MLALPVLPGEQCQVTAEALVLQSVPAGWAVLEKGSAGVGFVAKCLDVTLHYLCQNACVCILLVTVCILLSPVMSLLTVKQPLNC